VPAPPVGATVLYTLGHDRRAHRGGYAVCFATVAAHNRDGTLALVVHTAAGEVRRTWVPPGPVVPGSRAAAGKWSPAPAA
jgi:hypothetical protein